MNPESCGLVNTFARSARHLIFTHLDVHQSIRGTLYRSVVNFDLDSLNTPSDTDAHCGLNAPQSIHCLFSPVFMSSKSSFFWYVSAMAISWCYRCARLGRAGFDASSGQVCVRNTLAGGDSAFLCRWAW